MRLGNLFAKNLKRANRKRVMISLKSYLQDFSYKQRVIHMRAMPIGKSVECVPANRHIPICSMFLRFTYDLRYFISMDMVNLNVDRQ